MEPGDQPALPGPPHVQSDAEDERTAVHRAIWEMGQQVMTLTQTQTSIQAALDAITQRLTSSAPPTTIPVPTPAPASIPPPAAPSAPAPSAAPALLPLPQGVPRFKQPTEFDGNASRVESFLNSIETAVSLQRAQLPTDNDKALFLSTYLKDGSPTSWFATVKATAPHLLHNFSGLLQHFRTHFGDPDVVRTSERKLRALTQTGSCAIYASKSREYHAHLHMTDQTKINRFYDGLKDGVKALLVGQTKPMDFDKYVDLCIRLDNEFHERELELKSIKKSSGAHPKSFTTYHTPRSNFTPSPAPTTSSTDPVPMEIDAIKRGPISKEEKERRRKEGLCFYCGQGKHSVDNCPNMSDKAKAARAKAKATPSAGKA